jgi:hypothetical protein
MGDDIILKAIGKGNIKAIMQVGGKMSHTTITQGLHVPKMKNNLISVSKLIFEGFKMEFDKDGCKVNDVQGVVVAKARKDKNLYLLNVKVRKDTAHITNSLDEGAMTHSQLLEGLKCESQRENNERVRNRGTLQSSQHFKG